MPRVFYCVYPSEWRERLLLDTIRLFANPTTKHPAHITVRGPYEESQDQKAVKRWSQEIENHTIAVRGCGSFFNDTQNTVFLHVEAPILQTLWYKPNYPDYTPHLTLYDGSSRTFAADLLGLVEELKPAISFPATELIELHSNCSYPLRHWYRSDHLEPFLDREVLLTELDAATEWKRLQFIATLLKHLTSEDSLDLEE